MGKKYMDTKKGSLEQSILDVWKDAAEMHEEGFDGRTKEYREHRAKLENKRVKREEKKNKPKMEQPETEHGSGEHAFEVGTKRFDDYTREITPGQVEEEIAELNALIEELEEGILGNIAKAAGKTVAKGAKVGAKKAKDAVKKKVGGSVIGKAFGKVKAGAKKAKDIGGKIKKAAKTGTAYGDQYDPMIEKLEIIESKLDEYYTILETELETEDLNEAASPDWAQPKNLRDTVIAMWTEASSAVNPKEREELDIDAKNSAKKMKRADEPAPNVTEEVEELDEKLTAKQKKIDVDGDGEIEGSDLAKLRKKAKKEGKDELEVAKEYKVASMKEALAKVWGLEEGGMKRMASGHGMKTFKPKPKEKKEGKKTDTGEDMAGVDLAPKIKEKK